jgi:antitoxin (DNA-binding transcriptional repressor) of toxin-antitoxin stability system
MPMYVNQKDAEHDIGKILEAVKDGQTVTITADNVPIALITPLGAPNSTDRGYGALKGKIPAVDWLEPMSEEDLALWEGTGALTP